MISYCIVDSLSEKGRMTSRYKLSDNQNCLRNCSTVNIVDKCDRSIWNGKKESSSNNNEWDNGKVKGFYSATISSPPQSNPLPSIKVSGNEDELSAPRLLGDYCHTDNEESFPHHRYQGQKMNNIIKLKKEKKRINNQNNNKKNHQLLSENAMELECKSHNYVNDAYDGDRSFHIDDAANKILSRTSIPVENGMINSFNEIGKEILVEMLPKTNRPKSIVVDEKKSKKKLLGISGDLRRFNSVLPHTTPLQYQSDVNETTNNNRQKFSSLRESRPKKYLSSVDLSKKAMTNSQKSSKKRRQFLKNLFSNLLFRPTSNKKNLTRENLLKNDNAQTVVSDKEHYSKRTTTNTYELVKKKYSNNNENDTEYSYNSQDTSTGRIDKRNSANSLGYLLSDDLSDIRQRIYDEERSIQNEINAQYGEKDHGTCNCYKLPSTVPYHCQPLIPSYNNEIFCRLSEELKLQRNLISHLYNHHHHHPSPHQNSSPFQDVNSFSRHRSCCSSTHSHTPPVPPPPLNYYPSVNNHQPNISPNHNYSTSPNCQSENSYRDKFQI
ncbi:hypothetical protein SNEBB_011248 [Seison nebaliae]|nr:hypothetical protein SNEBB_011248 [Seison nebaliae]